MDCSKRGENAIHEIFLSFEMVEDLLRNITQSIPLSRTMKEQIDALREWAVTRARPASSQATVPVVACKPVPEETPDVSRLTPEGDARPEPLDGSNPPDEVTPDVGAFAGASRPAPELATGD